MKKETQTNSQMTFQKDSMTGFKRLFIVSLCLISFEGLAQREIPAQPEVEKAVYDYADMLSSAEEKALRQKLETYADTSSTQIVIATINSLEGTYIATYATEWAQQWGIGQDGKDNGAIILVSKNDRKITIQNGYGLEEYLTDYNSKTIIDQIIEPEFKKGNFYNGLDMATSAMIDLLAGNFDAEGLQNKKQSDFDYSKLIPLVFFIIFIILIIVRKNRGGGGRGSGGRRRSPDLFDILVLSSLGGSHRSGGSFGGSSGGFGGGGFSGGFGGGGFGGGGAVGGW